MKLGHLVVTGLAAVILASHAVSHGPSRPLNRVNSISAATQSASSSQGKTGAKTKPGTTQGRPGQGKTGGKKLVGGTTGGVHGQGSYSFVPGQDGNIPWNTTRKVGATPIMLYLFNCEDRKGESYDFSRTLETSLLRDKKLVRGAREFTCEKICHDSPYFKDKVKGREMMHPFIEKLSKEKKIDTQIVFLDSKGEVIKSLKGMKTLKKLGPIGLRKEMEKAAKVNEKRLAAKP